MAQSRWIPVLVMVAVMAVALLAAGPAAAGNVKTAKSTVTITSGEGTGFTGRVSSAKKQCRAGRTVKLFYEPGGGQASVVGTARTGASGAWDMEGSFLAGEYQAKVTAKLVHTSDYIIRCQGDVTLQARF